VQCSHSATLSAPEVNHNRSGTRSTGAQADLCSLEETRSTEEKNASAAGASPLPDQERQTPTLKGSSLWALTCRGSRRDITVNTKCADIVWLTRRDAQDRGEERVRDRRLRQAQVCCQLWKACLYLRGLLPRIGAQRPQIVPALVSDSDASVDALSNVLAAMTPLFQ